MFDSFVSAFTSIFGRNAVITSKPPRENLTWRDAIDRGWHSYQHSPPMIAAEKIWIWRLEWDCPLLVDQAHVDPEMNVNGLWWKPWRASEGE